MKEFPSLEARGDSRGGALRALKSVVYAVAKDLAHSGAEAREVTADPPPARQGGDPDAELPPPPDARPLPRRDD